jgi:hypothetical protein
MRRTTPSSWRRWLLSGAPSAARVSCAPWPSAATGGRSSRRRAPSKGGFGYDPLFLHAPSGATFAELSDRDKNRVSHRARALEAVAGFLRARTAQER